MNTKLDALGADMAARMQAYGLSRAAKIDKILVDEEGAMMPVEGALADDEVFYFVDPRRVVDQIFKGRAGLVNLLQVEPIGGAVVMGVDVTGPLARF